MIALGVWVIILMALWEGVLTTDMAVLGMVLAGGVIGAPDIPAAQRLFWLFALVWAGFVVARALKWRGFLKGLGFRRLGIRPRWGADTDWGRLELIFRRITLLRSKRTLFVEFVHPLLEGIKLEPDSFLNKSWQITGDADFDEALLLKAGRLEALVVLTPELRSAMRGKHPRVCIAQGRLKVRVGARTAVNAGPVLDQFTHELAQAAAQASLPDRIRCEPVHTVRRQLMEATLAARPEVDLFDRTIAAAIATQQPDLVTLAACHVDDGADLLLQIATTANVATKTRAEAIDSLIALGAVKEVQDQLEELRSDPQAEVARAALKALQGAGLVHMGVDGGVSLVEMPADAGQLALAQDAGELSLEE